MSADRVERTSAWPGVAADLRQTRLLAWARRRLAGIPGVNAAQEARALLEWALDVDDLWTAPDPVGARAVERLRTGVARRRHRVPLQHITGRMWFRGLRLRARPGVFVVRPETEVVAGHAIEAARAAGRDALVVDLCSGSGAIALAVAAEVPDAHVIAVEQDPAAVGLARENLRDLSESGVLEGEHVEVVQGDAMTARRDLDGHVDVVVSNPPYVSPVDAPTQPEARADPPMALFGGGEDGLVIPRGIVHRAAALLAPGGWAVIEHSESQSGDLRRVAAQAGFVDVRTLADLAGRDRMLVARRPAAGDVRTGRHACDNGAVSDSPVLDCTSGIDSRTVASVTDRVRAGGLVVLPTDTVYGIGADAGNADAVAAVLAAKGRGRAMPPPVLVANPGALDLLCVDVPDAARRLAASHWPGGLTLILTARPDLGWDLGETGGTVALRMPDHPVALAVLEGAGPMAVTSANLTGYPPSTSVGQAIEFFGQTVATYLDGGPTPGETPSTIIDLAHGRPRAIRVGAIDLATLSRDAGCPILAPG